MKKPKTDNTRNERQKDRRNDVLNRKAKLKGWTGYSEMLTAMKKDEIEIPEKPKAP